MHQEIQLRLPPEQAAQEEVIGQKAAEVIGISADKISQVRILKRSIDARQQQVYFNLKLSVWYNEIPPQAPTYEFPVQNVANGYEVHIVGSGPAGLFAALQCIKQGLKPILIERGKDVRSRRFDLAAINKKGIVNPNSNYCFGEGGAGTYSDGKLYTRSKKRGDVQQILETLVAFGASEDILIDAHPHIGTNKLPQIIENIRNTIIECGGAVHFKTKLIDLVVKNGAVCAIETSKGKMEVQRLVLATGHSARDIYKLLADKQIKLEAKSYALGVRIEHPQAVIDSIQYHCDKRSEDLPPASYSLAHQAMGRGVYSFCMCPGGIIAPCATAPGEVVTNGWSPSKRNNPYANSGIVVSVQPTDFKEFEHYGALAGLQYQSSIEQKCWEAAGKTQAVPAQRMMDFIDNKTSQNIPATSYQPGTKAIKMDDVLPGEITIALREGLKQFGNKMKGYATNEAVLHATESRTSSPVRIPRNPETMQHPQVEGLYPCGEGAGYAGGIVSAAIDGIKCAKAISAQ